MVIELDPVPPFASQAWLTDGVAEFLAETTRWERQHLGCGRDGDFPLGIVARADADGLFSVVVWCVCGRRRSVFGWPGADDAQTADSRRAGAPWAH